MAYTEVQLLEDCHRNKKRNRQLEFGAYQAVWGSVVRWVLAQFKLYKGANIPSFGRLTWRRDPGQAMRPTLVLADTFASANGLTCRGGSVGAFPCRDLNFSDLQLRSGEGAMATGVMHDIIEQLGTALGSGNHVKINMGVGTLRAKDRKVDFQFDKVWRKNLHDGEATPGTPASVFSWVDRPESSSTASSGGLSHSSSFGGGSHASSTSGSSDRGGRHSRARWHRSPHHHGGPNDSDSPYLDPASPPHRSPHREHHHPRHRSHRHRSPSRARGAETPNPEASTSERLRPPTQEPHTWNSGPIVVGVLAPTVEFAQAEGGPVRTPSSPPVRGRSPPRSPAQRRPASAAMPLGSAVLGLDVVPTSPSKRAERPSSVAPGGKGREEGRASPMLRGTEGGGIKVERIRTGSPEAAPRRPSTAAVLGRPPPLAPEASAPAELGSALFRARMRDATNRASSLPGSRESLSKYLTSYFDKGLGAMERLVDKNHIASSLEGTRLAAYQRLYADMAELQVEERRVLQEVESRRHQLEARAQKLAEHRKRQGRDLQAFLRQQIDEKQERERLERIQEKELEPIINSHAIPWEPLGTKAELHGKRVGYGQALRAQIKERASRRLEEVQREREEHTVLMEGAAASLQQERIEQLERRKQEQRLFFHTWAIQRKEKEKMASLTKPRPNPLPCSPKGLQGQSLGCENAALPAASSIVL